MSTTTETKYKLGWLYPNTLYLHGERGNVLALSRLADEMGMELEVEKIELGESIDFKDFDILFCPPGELASAETVIEELSKYKNELEEFIKSGKILLVTGTSLALFGQNIKRLDHSVIEGLGLIGIESEEKESVYGDDLIFKTRYNDQELTLCGNQIQMIDINLKDEKPFGKLIYGYGNTGKTKDEGIILKNSIFTNTLGPILVLNPWLTKCMLEIMRENRGERPFSKEIKFPLEFKSLRSKVNYTKNKKKSLKNV